MQHCSKNTHFFYLAPIRGITDALFRTIYHTHFPYFDAAVAPFINPQKYVNLKDKFIVDLLPENNSALPVVPQLLYNTIDDFINLGKRLEGLGYSHINWNLGCPAPMVANKKRGSGLLPYTDRIIELLEAVIPALQAEISIKTRLGFREPTDILALLPRLEHLPVKEITIHPRIGKQLYSGTADSNCFDACRKLTSHTLIYNGDIITHQDYIRLSQSFDNIHRWMLGRGALANPFLLADIKGIQITEKERRSKLIDFHDDLYQQLRVKLNGPGHLLNRMKQMWIYFIQSFPENKKALKKIQKSATEAKYNEALNELFSR